MKRYVAAFLIITAIFSFSSCSFLLQEDYDNADYSLEESLQAEYLTAAQNFYDKISENAASLDIIAIELCSVWKDADYNDSVEKINKNLEKVKENHQERIDAVLAFDAEIEDLFNTAKLSAEVEFEVKLVMNSYLEYRDSILNANAALQDHGYISISSNKDTLQYHLRALFVDL